MRRRSALALGLLLAAAAAVHAAGEAAQAGEKAQAAATAAADSKAAGGKAGGATAADPKPVAAAAKAGTGAAKANDGAAAKAVAQEAAAAQNAAAAKTAGEEEEEGPDESQPEPQIGAAAVEEKVVATEEELDQAVEEGAAAQQQGKRKKVRSKLVAQAKEAELPGGDADVGIGGACKKEIQQFCRKVKPGEGRLARCLTKRQRAAAAVAKEGGREQGLSPGCRTELRLYKEAVSRNVNANVPIAKACKKAIQQFCSKIKPEDEGGVLDCLRKRRQKLQGRCQALVFELEQDAGDDYRLDTKLLKACGADITRLCSQDIENPFGGNVQACLVPQQGSLSWNCSRELFREEMEQSDDIRLSLGLLQDCFESKEKFCEGVAPGQSNVKDCLEFHMFEEGFGDSCRERLEGLIEQRSKYFRLDSVLRQHCADDIVSICGVDRSLVESVDMLGGTITYDDEGISRCLQDHRSEITNPTCAQRVRRVMAATFRDVSFNHPLADACAQDRESLCAHEPLGSASVLRCLSGKREQLQPKCAAMLFDTEVAMAENIDFNWPLKEACSDEIGEHCGGVEHGRARVIRCLQQAADEHEEEFSDKCKAAVRDYEARAGADFRLNFRLASACEDDITALCPNACGGLLRKTSCGGSMLRCLAERQGDLTSDDCQAEVEYFQRMRVRHFKNDVELAEACRSDVEERCKDEPESKVLACLHKYRARLSPECRAVVTRLDVLQSRSIDLRPQIAKACRDERRVHCKQIKPGRAGVLNCLLTAAPSALDFGRACVEALGNLQHRRLLDWRIDYQLREACKEDVKAQCSEEAESSGPHSTTAGLDGEVFRCLVNSHASLAPACGRQVTRAALTALEWYKEGLPAVDACDEDVRALCHRTLAADMPALAVIKDCMAEHLGRDRDVEDALATTTSVSDAGAAVSEPNPGLDGERRRRLQEAGAGGGRQAGEAAWRRKQREGRAGKTGGEAAGQEPGGKAANAEEEGAAAEAEAASQEAASQEPLLSVQCRSFLDVALPRDVYETFQDSMTATGVLTQLASIEAGLGLPHGTLHNPDAETGKDVLTLTGWAALAGMFALATVVLSVAVYVVRRYTGMGAPNASARGYTMVVKHETEMAPPGGASGAAGGSLSPAVRSSLPRRYG